MNELELELIFMRRRRRDAIDASRVRVPASQRRCHTARIEAPGEGPRVSYQFGVIETDHGIKTEAGALAQGALFSFSEGARVAAGCRGSAVGA